MSWGKNNDVTLNTLMASVFMFKCPGFSKTTGVIVVNDDYVPALTIVRHLVDYGKFDKDVSECLYNTNPFKILYIGDKR